MGQSRVPAVKLPDPVAAAGRRLLAAALVLVRHLL